MTIQKEKKNERNGKKWKEFGIPSSLFNAIVIPMMENTMHVAKTKNATAHGWATMNFMKPLSFGFSALWLGLRYKGGFVSIFDSKALFTFST